ncbi:MAG: methylmalonyl-CoA mutase family protein [Salinibacter sp.]
MASSLDPLFEEFPPTSTEEWRTNIRSDLGGANLDEVLTWEAEGIEMPAVLRREDLADLAHVNRDADAPPLAASSASAPNGWRIRQDISHPNPEIARRLADRAVEQGATDLGLVPPRRPADGLDLSASDLLPTILGGIDLHTVRLHLDGGPAAPVLFSALLNGAESKEATHGTTVGFDPVATQAHGAGPPPPAAFDLAADLATSAPEGVRTLAVDTRVYHESGGTAVQELAYALGALSDSLAHLLDRGVSLPSLLPRIHVRVSVSPRYFVDLAKLRALRLLMPQLVSAFAMETASDATLRPEDVFIQAETSRRTETVYDPHVNMLRGTTEAMAAVLGGCDVLSVRPFDASLRPSENVASRIARNTQLILDHESHFDRVADPAAGAYYIEGLTDRLARAAWSSFQSLEAAGGLLSGLHDGTVQSTLQARWDERQADVNDRAAVMVGTNHYPDLEETRLEDLQDGHSPGASQSPGTPNVPDASPPTTLSEIRSALQHAPSLAPVVGRLSSPAADIEPLPSARLSEDIEALRLRTERFAQNHGAAPVVALAPIGPAGPRSARATFARNFFGVAGFRIIQPLRYDDPASAAAEAATENADIVVLCSSDDESPALARSLRTALDAASCDALLVVAGHPSALDGENDGVDAYIHRERSLLDALKEFQRRLGLRERETQ